jgi:tetratricopeptide (TPR) repeat protein
MVRFFILTLLCVACTPTPEKSRRHSSDSLLPFLKNTVNPLLQNRDATEARKKLDSIWPIIEKKGDYLDLCSWLRCTAVTYQIENRLDSARLYANRALQLAMEKDTTQRQILAGKIQIADIMREQHSLDSALRYAHDAYFLAQQIDTPGLPFICLKLYNIYEKIGDLPMQKKYLFEGFNRSTNAKHKTVFATNISEYYDKLNQVDSALLFFQALLKDSSFSNPYYDAVRYETLGTLLSKKGQVKEGLAYQLKGLEIRRRLDEPDAQSYFNIAMTYGKLGDFTKESALLDTALIVASAESAPALQKKIWQAMAQNFKGQKKFENASSAMDSAFAYFQQEVETSIIVRARELETQYGLLEKDYQITSLALANQAGEKMRERQRKIIVRICSGAIILGFLLVWFWRRKHYKRLIREDGLRQQLLRGQIESHFLFNAVSCLKGLIREGNTDEATPFVERLAQLFWLSLENARQPFVALKNELQALVCYLQLQQTLLNHRFDYAIEVEGMSDEATIMIPPMLLQPFAENAILHGFKDQPEKGQINICIKKTHNTLHCIIEDNGRGFQGAEKHGHHKRSLSTAINQERLAILSRQTKTVAKLTIVDKKAAGGEPGVRVELILPYLNGVQLTKLTNSASFQTFRFERLFKKKTRGNISD